jgi:hypothetical protein
VIIGVSGRLNAAVSTRSAPPATVTVTAIKTTQHRTTARINQSRCTDHPDMDIVMVRARIRSPPLDASAVRSSFRHGSATGRKCDVVLSIVLP